MNELELEKYLSSMDKYIERIKLTMTKEEAVVSLKRTGVLDANGEAKIAIVPYAHF